LVDGGYWIFDMLCDACLKFTYKDYDVRFFVKLGGSIFEFQ